MTDNHVFEHDFDAIDAHDRNLNQPAEHQIEL